MRIDLELRNYRSFVDENPLRITLADRFVGLIGSNNSGKSSFLRLFYELRPLFGWLATNPTALPDLITGSAIGWHPAGTSDPAELLASENDRGITITFSVDDGALDQSHVPEEVEILFPRATPTQFTLRGKLSGAYLAAPYAKTLSIAGTTVQTNTGETIAEFEPYVSAWRDLFNSTYLPPFRNAINIGAQNDYYDMPIGQAFITNWHERKSGAIKSNNQAALAVESEIGRIFGYQSLQINASPDHSTLQMIVDGHSYRLHEMGAGVTHFVIALMAVATRKPNYVFIDEPELNLHPSLQLDFLTSLGAFASSGVVFATHNLGLARSSADTIYSFRRVRQGYTQVAEYNQTPRLSEFVGELSFAGHKDVAFTAILLVEGPSDVRVVQRLLRLHHVEHRVVLMPLGGGSLINEQAETQLLELLRITPQVYALIDSEREAADAPLEAGRAGFARACERADVPCHILQRRAMENYFPESAVQRVKGPKHRALEPYQKLSECSPHWGKSETGGSPRK